MIEPSLRGGGSGSAAVLILHGGRERGHSATNPRQLAYLRMIDLYVGLRLRARDTAVYLLRHRVRGWNSELSEPSPVTDARWALRRITRDRPDVRIALLGHSMGGRTAFAVADDPAVVGVCALAPWLPPGEPLPDGSPDQRFVIAHGTADRITSPTASLAYARRLRQRGDAVAYLPQVGGRHALLDHPRAWHRLAVGAPLAMLGERRWAAALEAQFRGEAPLAALELADMP
jgi:alpha-beta hydrolase superfamily lysophospholipase